MSSATIHVHCMLTWFGENTLCIVNVALFKTIAVNGCLFYLTRIHPLDVSWRPGAPLATLTGKNGGVCVYV